VVHNAGFAYVTISVNDVMGFAHAVCLTYGIIVLEIIVYNKCVKDIPEPNKIGSFFFFNKKIGLPEEPGEAEQLT